MSLICKHFRKISQKTLGSKSVWREETANTQFIKLTSAHLFHSILFETDSGHELHTETPVIKLQNMNHVK